MQTLTLRTTIPISSWEEITSESDYPFIENLRSSLTLTLSKYMPDCAAMLILQRNTFPVGLMIRSEIKSFA